MEFLRETRIDFLGKKILAIGLSLIVITTCVIYVSVETLHLGIDFAGGNLIYLKYQKLPRDEAVRLSLAVSGYGKAILQVDKDNNVVMIRVQRKELEGTTNGEGDSEGTAQVSVVNKVIDALTRPEDLEKRNAGLLDLNLAGKERLTKLMVELDPLGYTDEKNLPPTMTAQRYARGKYEDVAEQLINNYRDIEYKGVFTAEGFEKALRSITVERDREKLINSIKENTFLGGFSKIGAEMVSATVGSELGEQAVWAVIFSLGGILAYIWFRFNPRFAVAAIIALIHDVTITAGVFSMTGREFNLPIVAGLLTVVGYSLNDTIVVFDRIRENLNIRRREAREDYEKVINYSINQTLSRTILTSLTTLIVVTFLFVLGGTVINDFAFTLIVGIIVGTYSSIFIASPVLAIWQKITGTMGGALART